MVLNSIVYFLTLAVSFFLFFFNVPYWTGRDMADMSKSGIWRAFFRFLSFLGYGLHRLYLHIAGWILDIPLNLFWRNRRVREDSPFFQGVVGFVDLLCSAATLFLMITVYNGFMDSMFPADIGALAEGTDGSLLGTLSEAVVFLRVVSGVKSGSGAGSAVAAVMVTLVALVSYVIINTLFFSILFGFLREHLEERPFLTLAKEKLNIPSAPPTEPDEEPSPAQRLLRQLKEATEGFFNKTTVHYGVYEPVALVLFLLALLIYSVVMTRLGKNDMGPWDVVKQVLDSIGVVQIVASFLVTYLAGKLSEKAAKSVVKVLPQGVQNAIHAASAKGNAWADAEDAKRHIWAQEHQVKAYQKDPTPKEEKKMAAHWRQGPPVKKEPVQVKEETEDVGAREILDAVDLVQTNFKQVSGSDRIVSREEIFALLDSGAVPGTEGWKDLKTDAERGVFIRQKAVDITIALMGR